MKTNELRIGNYVELIIAEGKLSNEVRQIKASEFFALSKNPDWAKPIELTEEWLIQFRLKTIHRLVYSKDRFELVYEQGLFRFYIGSDWIDITKVHQLQNLYFVLKGEELKIDK